MRGQGSLAVSCSGEGQSQNDTCIKTNIQVMVIKTKSYNPTYNIMFTGLTTLYQINLLWVCNNGCTTLTS